jgi:putative integral membrane protein (TIGR02587 family)
MAQQILQPWQKEISDYTRAFSGAFLFGIPLLFTMEMWWIGMYASLWKLIAFLILTFVVTIGINFAVGFKKESTFNSLFVQAVSTMAVGIVAAYIVLFILGRITIDTPLGSILGQVIVQAVPLSIGASLGNSLLGKKGDSREGEKKKEKFFWKKTLQNSAVSAIGGLFIGLTVAPTDEIPKLAAEIGYFHTLGIIIFSLLLSYMIVYESGFDPQNKRAGTKGTLRISLTESATAYGVSLGVAFILLYFFARIGTATPWPFALSEILVLGIPTCIGAAAGRIVA